MKISCVIVSYNNGSFLEEAIISVLAQSRPVDEIIVSDDASTDGSREAVLALSHKYSVIRPILRGQNIGVSRNRDSAIREATGDFVTTLDGDDLFLPGKIEAEALSLERSSALIAYSDIRVIYARNNLTHFERIPEFSLLGTSERVRWLLGRKSHNPQDMLFQRELHDKIGGYNPALRTYEDWDYKIRLAEYDCKWVHSGVTGVVIRRHEQGLSAMAPLQHLRDRQRVLRINRDLARRHVGLVYLSAIEARVALSGVKWSAAAWYWEKRREISKAVERRGRTR